MDVLIEWIDKYFSTSFRTTGDTKGGSDMFGGLTYDLIRNSSSWMGLVVVEGEKREVGGDDFLT